jgi:DNA-binding transcriptional regulator YiaG
MKKRDCMAHARENSATHAAPFHDIDSGLPNVYLEGMRYWTCTECERVVRLEIPAVEDLMNALARAVVSKPSPLTALELRFVRKRLGMKAAAFAGILSISAGQLSRFKNGHNRMDGSLDKLVRLSYALISRDKKLESLTRQFERWSTRIQAADSSERILAAYKQNRHWCAEAESMAALELPRIAPPVPLTETGKFWRRGGIRHRERS